jgi:hypothetical protein
MQLSNELDLALEGGADSIGQQGPSVLVPLSAPDRDLREIEVDVLDPQRHGFAHPDACPIDGHPDQTVFPGKVSEQTLDLST